MRKFLFILAALFTISLAAGAQTQEPKAFVQATVATQSGQFSQGLEIGAQTGKNRASIVGETFEAADSRQYFAGIKYARAVFQGRTLDFLLTGQALAHIDDSVALSVAPGAELDFHLGKNLSLVGAISSPLYQDQAPFNSLNLKGSVGLQVRF